MSLVLGLVRAGFPLAIATRTGQDWAPRSAVPPCSQGRFDKLPSIEPDRWIALQPFTGALHGVIVYGLKNEAAARKEIAAKGYFEYTRDRLLRAA